MSGMVLRGRELGLLCITACLYLTGYAMLVIERKDPLVPATFVVPVGFLVLLLVVHLWLSVIGFRGDQFMFPTVSMLVGLSLLMVDRLRPSLLRSQLLWFAFGCLILVVIATWGTDLLWLARYKYTFAVAGMVLLLFTALFGHEINGARLWLRVGPFQFQTSEVMKLVLVVFMAAYLEEKGELLSLATFQWRRLKLPPIAYLGPLLMMWVLSLLSLIWQRDLGGTLLLLGVALAMMYVATGRRYYVVGGMALFVFNLVVTYRLFGYVRNRIIIWLHPWEYAADKSYQIVQAFYAMSSGGVLGSGLGQGAPKYIPEVHTDFIYAAIVEELGLLGGTAILALFLILIFRGLRTALDMNGTFEKLLAVGFAAILALQALVIVGGNLSVIPLTGITLPFVSYGGSSMVVNFIVVGLLLQLSAKPERLLAARAALEPFPVGV